MMKFTEPDWLDLESVSVFIWQMVGAVNILIQIPRKVFHFKGLKFLWGAVNLLTKLKKILNGGNLTLRLLTSGH
jgi:hypothetical protein